MKTEDVKKHNEIEELLKRWHNAVTKLWSHDVIAVSREALIECPCYSKVFDESVTVSLSVRGVEASVGSEPTPFDRLLYTSVFKLSNFKLVREFVVESIKKGKGEVAAQIQARAKMIESGFDDFKKEIAEWNLQSDKGHEV